MLKPNMYAKNTPTRNYIHKSSSINKKNNSQDLNVSINMSNANNVNSNQTKKHNILQFHNFTKVREKAVFSAISSQRSTKSPIHPLSQCTSNQISRQNSKNKEDFQKDEKEEKDPDMISVIPRHKVPSKNSSRQRILSNLHNTSKIHYESNTKVSNEDLNKTQSIFCFPQDIDLSKKTQSKPFAYNKLPSSSYIKLSKQMKSSSMNMNNSKNTSKNLDLSFTASRGKIEHSQEPHKKISLIKAPITSLSKEKPTNKGLSKDKDKLIDSKIYVNRNIASNHMTNIPSHQRNHQLCNYTEKIQPSFTDHNINTEKNNLNNTSTSINININNFNQKNFHAPINKPNLINDWEHIDCPEQQHFVNVLIMKQNRILAKHFDNVTDSGDEISF